MKSDRLYKISAVVKSTKRVWTFEIWGQDEKQAMTIFKKNYNPCGKLNVLSIDDTGRIQERLF